MVLEAKSPILDLPLIVLEIQHTINIALVRRAVNHCLQAFARYNVEPIILIICVEKLHQDIDKHMTTSMLPGAFSYFLQLWAQHCYIISKESIQKNITIFLNPLIALGSFFTNRSSSIINSPFNNDPIIQYLYILALHQHQIDTINKDMPLTLMGLQFVEYDRLITLTNTSDQPLLVEAVNDAKSRALTMNRKHNDLYTVESSSSITNVIEPKVDKNSDMYEAVMKFVAEFKQKKVEEGKRTDWMTCQKEGKDLKILNYKNTESLHN